jgi:hypothetical protein
MLRYFLVLLGLLLCLSGCRSYVPMQDQMPVVEYKNKNKNKILISVVDGRSEKTDYSPSYIGTTIMAFGIPRQRSVDFISGEPGDENKSLAMYLQERVYGSLELNGLDVKSINLTSLPSSQEAVRIMSNERANKLLVININDWYFSLNLSGAFGLYSTGSFLFKNDVDVYVLSIDEALPLKQNITGPQIVKISDFINENTQGKNFPNMFVLAFKNQLSNILNEDRLKEALQK